MPPTKLPDNDHVIRFIRKRLLRRDENGNILGILPQALELREGEQYLSTTWLEHFHPEYERGLVRAAEATRRQLTVKPKDGFSTTKIGVLRRICESFGHRVRTVREPVIGNSGHVAIRRFPRDNLELMEELAARAFVDTRLASDVPLD